MKPGYSELLGEAPRELPRDSEACAAICLNKEQGRLVAAMMMDGEDPKSIAVEFELMAGMCARGGGGGGGARARARSNLMCANQATGGNMGHNDSVLLNLKSSMRNSGRRDGCCSGPALRLATVMAGADLADVLRTVVTRTQKMMTLVAQRMLALEPKMPVKGDFVVTVAPQPFELSRLCERRAMGMNSRCRWSAIVA